jgi:S-DNA-T family DNA segregation ATPase FtsK/SpoIIIE
MPRARKSRRSKRKKNTRPAIRLSRAARLQIAGLGLLMLAMVTLLSLLSLSNSRLTAAWLALLARAFGWGRLVIPFGMGMAGVLIFLAGIDRPVALPWRRVLGLILLFLAAEGIVHGLSYASEPEALAGAEAGGGGGYLGWAIWHALRAGLGGIGGLFVLFFVAGGAALLILDRRPADIVAALVRAWDAATAWYRLRRVPVSGGLPPVQPERPSEGLLERLAEPVLRPRPEPEEVEPPREVPPPRPQPATGQQRLVQPRVIGALHEWRLPPLEEILEPGKEQELSDVELRMKAHIIEQTLSQFGVPARVVEVNQGPTVTQFGLEPGFIERRTVDGKVRRFKVKVNKIQSLANDLALALSATTIRIEAPVPGRPMVGVEIPNDQAATVTLRSVMESEAFGRLTSRLRIGLGIDVSGQPIVADLATMPHLLIAGATGAGKSVCINAIIACLLCSNTPDELRLIMIDPKRVELTGYNGVPHLLTPVVVDIERVVGTLKWVTREMDRRYEVFAKVGVRNIEGYNAWATQRDDPPLPLLVVLIDELADLMMVAPDEVERSVCRIAQMARATGIHLVMATQRPSVDVVTGLIKANFPARISFAVSTQVDSRVILDSPGAEQLLGRGDMLWMAPDANKLVRLQGCFVSDAEIERLASYWKGLFAAQEAALPPSAAEALVVQRPLWEEVAQAEKEEGDPLLDDAINLVREQNRASVSLLQRKLRVGYARAARIMDLLEDLKIVGPPEGANYSREVLPPEEDEAGEMAGHEYEYEEGGE